MQKKILITGMTAQQCSALVMQKNVSYASLLRAALAELGHDIDYSEPDVSWTETDMKKYDKVLVGVSSPMSLASNNAYGAFSLISALRRTEKLALFIDAPEPGKIFSSLKSIDKNPGLLVKKFYARRRGYKETTGNRAVQARVFDGASALFAEKWPVTLFPALPWERDPHDMVGVMANAADAMVPLCLDALYKPVIQTKHHADDRKAAWGVDQTDTKWLASVKHSMTMPYEPIRATKAATDIDIEEKISSLFGVLLGSYDDKRTWWSPRFAQALATGTPIVTDWRRSASLGAAWSNLAGAVEKMSHIDRYELSVMQKASYFGSIPSKDEAFSQITKAI